MKISTGYVAVKPDGTFLYVSERHTHTGYHIDIAEVASIEDASVMRAPAFMDRAARSEAERLGVTWVPVEVRREVVLKGYGVKR